VTTWFGILINMVPLLLVGALIAGAVKRSRVGPAWQFEGRDLTARYRQRGAVARFRVDRAARVVLGYPLGKWSSLLGVFIDVLDGEGTRLMRFSSQSLSLPEFRRIIAELRAQHANLELAPEIDAILAANEWPRSLLYRFRPLLFVAIIGLFFAFNSLITLLGSARPAH
jgi:hypothetical protein